MRIGIFGGTFNPPHLAHLLIAELSREAYSLDRILWIPNANPPHKESADLAPVADRLAMVKLAIANNPFFEVSEIEIERHGTSYTIDTIRELKRKSPANEYFLLIGGDSLAEFRSWREPEGILKEVRLIVYDRPGVAPFEHAFSADRVLRMPVPQLEISGTEIRRRCTAGTSIRYLVPDSVKDYIRVNNLYAS